MARNPNTTVQGLQFDESKVDQVWDKGSVIPDFSKDEWRRDAYGTAIKHSQYGNVNSEHGWEIDHIKPVSKGGIDDISNLQPLHWEKNRKKADNYPWNP